jgi:homoserine kinase
MKKPISVHVKIPATSANMGPGFDVVGVALQFFNEATFIAEGPFSPMRRPPTLRIEVSGEGVGLLPLDATNLVYRAAAHVFEKAKMWPLALHMKLVNRIPLARGMGSSAAAVLAGVIGANALCGKPLTEQALLDLAVMLEGHPDNIVPAFYGGFCISSLENNETRYLKFPVPAGLYPVVCVPELPLATQKARQVLPSRVAFSAAVYTASHLAFLVGGLLQKRQLC